MTAQTQAQRSATHRARKAERMRVMEEALREIIVNGDSYQHDGEDYSLGYLAAAEFAADTARKALG